MPTVQPRHDMHASHDPEPLPVLPEDVPVVMPPLPHLRVLTTVQELKALGDPLRSRILGLIQYYPATAKQIADHLGIAPSSVGHHMHVLEAAGLVQIVARRSVRGTIANYYARTAIFFQVELPQDIAGTAQATLSSGLDRMAQAHDDLAQSISSSQHDAMRFESFLHFKLALSRVHEYERRLQALNDAFMQEEPDPDGHIYTFYAALFLAPPALQNEQAAQMPDTLAGPVGQHAEHEEHPE